MKKTKIIIPALGMLLLSTAASVSGTVAWFSMNNSVTVTGMTVTTKVSSNLQIADGDAAHAEANYGDSLEQARTGILEPASTADGEKFYYTVSAAGDGSAKDKAASTYTLYSEEAVNDPNNALANTYAKKTHFDKTFNTSYGFGTPALGTQYEQGVCYAYIDYSFYLKAGYSVAEHRLMMTKCEMLYNGGSAYGAITTAWAWRVGMYVKDASEGVSVEDSAVAQDEYLKTVLDFANSKNQNEMNKPVQKAVGDDVSGLYQTSACTGDPIPSSSTVTAEGTYQPGTYYIKGDAAPKGVSGTANTALTAVANANANAYVDTNPTLNTTKRYKVIVRLWLEGEDISCTSSTFARLTNDWSLDLEFKLGDPAVQEFSPIQNITTSGSNQEPNA